MADLEDKLEQELSKVKLGTMVHYSLLWTHIVGICIVLGMGAYGLKQYKLLNPPKISAKVLSYEINNEKEDPYYPIFEYEYAGKKYKNYQSLDTGDKFLK